MKILNFLRVHFIRSVIQQYFGGTFEVQMSCDEAPEEQTTCSTEDFLQLSCFISQEVKYMQSGLKSVIYFCYTIYI